MVVLITNLDPVAGGRRPLLAVRVRTIGEETLQELVATAANEVQQVLLRYNRHILLKLPKYLNEPLTVDMLQEIAYVVERARRKAERAARHGD